MDFAAAGNLSKGPFLILYVTFLKTKYDHINSGFRLFQDLKTSHIKHVTLRNRNLIIIPKKFIAVVVTVIYHLKCFKVNLVSH